MVDDQGGRQVGGTSTAAPSATTAMIAMKIAILRVVSRCTTFRLCRSSECGTVRARRVVERADVCGSDQAVGRLSMLGSSSASVTSLARRNPTPRTVWITFRPGEALSSFRRRFDR